jgi:hypothetical protein
MWGGRISDKELTGKTRFYDYIEFGDQVMAHRGFAISTELAQGGATLVISPHLLKVGSSCLVLLLREPGSCQPLEFTQNEPLKESRISAILKNTMPLTQVPLASEILTVCSALTNLHDQLLT